MAPTDTAAHRPGHPAAGAVRSAWADNLKVVLVAGVIVAHATMAWTGVGNWVFTESPVREPLLSLLVLLAVVGSLFGMALFFQLAGMFTPPSLARKGLRRFLGDRALRLGVPLLVFIVLFAPFVEYVDPENADWNGSFLAFAWTTVWWPWPLPPAWGPTWFLAVLLAFSVVYAVARHALPRRSGPSRLRARHLAVAAAGVAVASYLIRIRAPLGDEPFRLALAQAPAWTAGFVLGVTGAERGWYAPLDPVLARRARHVAWATVASFALVIATASVVGVDIDVFSGGGTWQSLLTAALEGVLVATMPLWLIDLFRRRVNTQGRLARSASRAAFAAFLIHQAVLVALVLASHRVTWPPEIEYGVVCALAVLASFTLGGLLVRLPGVSRIL